MRLIHQALIAIFISIPFIFTAQNVHLKIEDLSKPENLLTLHSCDDIYQRLILEDVSLSKFQVESNQIDFEYNIIAKSEAPDSLVSFGYNSFFYGMYQAYADHRPFVLSPDMIWLLINQGFARHVNANSEKLRKHFVDFSGQLKLEVRSEHDLLRDTANWDEIFSDFTSQIAQHTGAKLISNLTSDFSTTTSVEKISSEITIMEAMENYFEYIVFYVVCGIPEIILEGTTEDWQKVLDKTKKIGEYDLKWWTRELEPILEQFVRASKGDYKRKFWRNMFKYHSQKKYGAPKIIDGWIVKFFPYDQDGNRNNLKKLEGGNSLPNEIVKVDMNYIVTDGIIILEETMLELWAGFIGLDQNPETHALTPQIGWMVKKKDINERGTLQKLEFENIPSHWFDSGIRLRINQVPMILERLDEIYTLALEFEEEVQIPEWLSQMRIGKLDITGNITAEEKQKIIEWFPNTDLTINREILNSGKNGWMVIHDFKNHDFEGIDEIWLLDIPEEDLTKDLINFVVFEDIKILNLSLPYHTEDEHIEILKNLLPNTNIFVFDQKIQSAK